jgi:hypothetical protein
VLPCSYINVCALYTYRTLSRYANNPNCRPSSACSAATLLLGCIGPDYVKTDTVVQRCSFFSILTLWVRIHLSCTLVVPAPQFFALVDRIECLTLCTSRDRCINLVQMTMLSLVTILFFDCSYEVMCAVIS